ncbi:TrbG/VirB9 family P-type conjugative transfer protein [Elstera sp.]|jgi:type IV secretion system protein VirB9|uniref:TrbG/VirB9 family P-type conjugative transfer protein n=1 Tax=Elstera sp. TaxID=1916664 RepID=UPI0037C0646E
MRAASISLLMGTALLTGCAYLPKIEFSRGSDPAPVALVEAVPQVVAPRLDSAPLPLERPAPMQSTPIAMAALSAPAPSSPARPAKALDLTSATQAATQTSQNAQFDGATTVYDYAVGGIYQVVARFNHITVIALQPGERFESASGGDVVRWKIDQQISGERDFLVIKPLKAGLKTNLLITTDRHEYVIDLVSVEADQPFNPRVAWNYPQEMQKIQAQRRQEKQIVEERETSISADPSRLDFRYRIETVSGNPAWKPTQVFTDGRQTWIQFRPDLGSVEAPVLFAQNGEGIVQLNYRIKNNFFVVDRAIAIAELVLGRDPQERVRITREGGAS